MLFIWPKQLHFLLLKNPFLFILRINVQEKWMSKNFLKESDSMKFIKSLVYTAVCASVLQCAQASDQSLNKILDAINKLEAKSEPKCYATASRLEDFMFGTPLSDEARFAKNLLQKDFINLIWQQAAQIALQEGEEIILKSHIIAAQNKLFKTEKTEKGHWRLNFNGDQQVTLHKDDKRQYGSIAYSLRAVLAVQQEALLDFDNNITPLTELAVNALKDSLDFYTLAALKVADNSARMQNERLIMVDNLNAVWLGLGATASSKELNPVREYKLIEPTLLNQMAERKLASYASYNRVSNQLFLRNLQVYFARVTWPSDKAQSDKIIDTFSQLLTQFSAHLYLGAQNNAMTQQLGAISEQAVYDFAMQSIPHKINEYEDALFFPNFSKDKQIYIESYDMDAFRDAGVHWVYLQQAISSPEFKLFIEPDPFAAELIVENIAQYGVLLLRVAGNLAKQEKSDYLVAEHIVKAQALLDKKIAQHKTAKESKTAAQKLASASESDKKVGFVNVTDLAGLNYQHRSSDWLNRQLRTFLRKDESTGIVTIPPAFGGSGVATEDINNDGLVDIFILGGRGNTLYLNQGDGKFSDVTEKMGLNWLRPEDGHPGESRQPIIADINNDGWQDIVVTYVNDVHRVYKNVDGKKFVDMTTEANLGGRNLVGGPATMFDFDKDGDLDLYITYFGNYIEGDLPTLKRRNTNGKPNQLFENVGDFKFKNVTQGSGLDNTGWAQAVAHTDLNGDDWQDVIVGNDFGVNSYYINMKDGSFKDISAEIGTDKPSYTMGIGITDLNQDNKPDVYISNIVTMNKDETYVLPNQDTQLKFNADKLAHMRVVEANDLFISEPNDALRYQNSDIIGRGYSSTGWAWDADFFDYDLDGDDDLYVLNGMNEFNLYSSKNPYYQDKDGNKIDAVLPVSEKEENVFFENTQGRLEVSKLDMGLNLLSNSRSAAYFDIENDGDLDIVINNYHEPAALFNNNLMSNNNWLKIKLTGDPKQQVSKDAIGARIYVTLVNGQRVWREVRSTDGYMSVHPKQQHFGLGNAKEVTVEVVWPNGKITKYNNIAANQAMEIAL